MHKKCTICETRPVFVCVKNPTPPRWLHSGRLPQLAAAAGHAGRSPPGAAHRPGRMGNPVIAGGTTPEVPVLEKPQGLWGNTPVKKSGNFCICKIYVTYGKNLERNEEGFYLKGCRVVESNFVQLIGIQNDRQKVGSL